MIKKEKNIIKAFTSEEHKVIKLAVHKSKLSSDTPHLKICVERAVLEIAAASSKILFYFDILIFKIFFKKTTTRQ
jgi:hypothetical protein